VNLTSRACPSAGPVPAFMYPTALENSCLVCAYIPNYVSVPIEFVAFIPEDGVNRPDSDLEGFGAMRLYLGAEERTLSRILLTSRGRFRPMHMVSCVYFDSRLNIF